MAKKKIKAETRERRTCECCNKKRYKDKMKLVGSYRGEYFQAGKEVAVYICETCSKKDLSTRLNNKMLRIR